MAGKTNYSALEKNVLLELVEERKDIIENKKNDGRMIGKKEEAWQDICKIFGSRHGVNKRTVKQLKALWKNMKGKAKKAIATERRERIKTGGGKADDTMDSVSQKINVMMPQQMNSLSNPYDDDADLHGDVAYDNEALLDGDGELACVTGDQVRNHKMNSNLITTLFYQNHLFVV